MLVKSVSFLTAIVLHKVTPTTKLNQQIHKKDIDKVLTNQEVLTLRRYQHFLKYNQRRIYN